MIDRQERLKIDQLFHEVAAKGMSRRQMVQRASVLGISGSALAMAFVAKAQQAIAQGAENPLGVDPEAPLDVVIFKGGYSDEFAIYVNDEMYSVLYPDAEIAYTGTQRLQEQFQARVVDGNPPDVMFNGGAGSFNTTSLYNEGQLANLDDLMASPAYGQDGVTFADSLRTDSQQAGVFEGGQFVLNHVIDLYGIWFNQALLDEHGWEYPQTWDDMLALCETIKTETDMAPWTYQGLYPGYMVNVLDELAYKAGGIEAMLKLDNLAEDAWTQEPVRAALEALRALHDNDYIMEGTAGLSHTESQTFWLEGDAVFIPCGAWLESEMKDVLEGLPDFEMTVRPAPSLSAEDALPMSAVISAAGADYIVFENGKNVQGGKEYLRLLFSQEGARVFSEMTHTATVVEGSTDGLDLGPAFASVSETLDAAGANTWVTKYGAWYADLTEEVENTMGGILTGEMTVDEMIERMQSLTNEVREDDSIPKYTREAPGAVATPAS